MNQSRQRLDPPDLSLSYQNQMRFPPEELDKYIGQYVAFSPDGTRILASGNTMEEVEKSLGNMGIDPSQVVGSYLPPPDWVLL